jgi:hypothetical protein
MIDQEMNMKTVMSVLFAGAMLASVSMATANDRWAEERLKAKTGRYSPGEEARRADVSRAARLNDEECAKHACCRRQHESAKDRNAAVGPTWTEEFLGAKFRRETIATAAGDHSPQPADSRTSGSADAWQRAKWGHSLSAPTDTQPVLRAASEEVTASRCDRPSCCD